jgi:hypothetical protein
MGRSCSNSGPLTLNFFFFFFFFFFFPVVVELSWPTFSAGIGLFLIGNESFEVFEIQGFSNLGHDLLCEA